LAVKSSATGANKGQAITIAHVIAGSATGRGGKNKNKKQK